MTSTMNDDLLQRARDGNVEAVKALLDAGADVHHRSKYGDTALHWAAREGFENEQAERGQRAATVRILLAAGADVHCTDQHGNTPLIEAVKAPEAPWENNHVDGRGGTIRALLAAGADVNAQGNYGATALGAARGREEIRDLLAAGADVNKSDLVGCTALMSAAAGTDVEITQLLLEHGAAVNEWDEDGDTALTIAARYGSVEQVQALVNAGADPNVRPADEFNQTALFFAVDQYTSGWVSDHASADKVRALLDAGARVDHQDDGGNTVLHLTSWRNLPKTAQVLLDHGADTTLVNRSGQTAEDQSDGDVPKMIKAHRERGLLQQAAGITDDQEPVRRSRRM